MKGGLPKSASQENLAPPVERRQEQLQTSKSEFGNISSGGEGVLNGEDRPDAPKTEPVRVEKKVGRNDNCPCGSGKKFKHCHGK